GADVDTLVCLDGFAPDTSGRPIGADLRFLAGILRGALSAVLGVGAVGRHTRRATELRRRFVANTTALLRYRPRPVPCRVVLFPAGAGTRAADRLRNALAGLYTEVAVH